MTDHDLYSSLADQARSAAEKFPDTAKDAAKTAAAAEEQRLAREAADMLKRDAETAAISRKPAN